MIDDLRLLDARLRGEWDNDVVTADDPRRAELGDAIAMPRPYVAGGAPASPPWYTTMFSWDAYFTNLALLVHDRPDLVRDAIDNYLAMIGRFGYMPNGNQTGLQTRSQTPLFPDSIARYVSSTGDEDVLRRAYPALVEEYGGYWLAEHHQTPTGLATNRDLGDPALDPRLAAEAETGLDWTTLYDGDVREVLPLVTNCALVRYAEVLSIFAAALGFNGEAERWRADADTRSARIRSLCWNEQAGYFYDFNYVTGRFVSGAGATGLWPLWARVATADQAARCIQFLPRLVREHGLDTTETARDNPYDEAVLPAGDLQWTSPAGWPPLQVIACWGLDAYGFTDVSADIATRYLATVLRHYAMTGELYEKYNVVDGGLTLPNSRYGTIPLHGWTSASIVLLGRRLWAGTTLDQQLPSLGRLP